MLGILNILVTIGSIICFIIVLVKLFQTEGVVQGIIGLICSIWTFIWGWMNAGKVGIKNLMIIWTILILLNIILGVAGGGFSYVGGGINPR
jgi:hypothetical protein